MSEKVKNSLGYKIAVEDLNASRIVTSTVGSICYNRYAKKVIDKGFKANATIYDMARSCAVSELNSRVSVSNFGVEGVGNVMMRVSDIVKANKDKKNDSSVTIFDDKKVVEMIDVKTKEASVSKTTTAKKAPKTSKKAV